MDYLGTYTLVFRTSVLRAIPLVLPCFDLAMQVLPFDLSWF